LSIQGELNKNKVSFLNKMSKSLSSVMKFVSEVKPNVAYMSVLASYDMIIWLALFII